jgi:NAD(P)-dependent dehydrogenase (short-subunit alcohol dehydrogenase family)
MALAGRIVVVTGGGSAIGRSISLSITRSGASVGILDVNRASAEHTVVRPSPAAAVTRARWQ